MTMRFRDNGSISFDSKGCIVVAQCRNIFLFDDVDLIFLKAEVVVRFEESKGLLRGIVGDHDTEGHVERIGKSWVTLHSSSSTSQSVLGIILHIRILVVCDCRHGERNFYRGEAEALAKTTGDEDKA